MSLGARQIRRPVSEREPRDIVGPEIIPAEPPDAQRPFDRELEQEKARAYTAWCFAAMFVLVVVAAIVQWWRA